MISVCRRRSVGSKRWWKSSVTSVCSVRERTTQEPCSRPIGVTSHTTPLPCGGGVGGGATSSWVRNSAQMRSVTSVSSVRKNNPLRVSKMFYFSQKNTEEQNTQRPTETLSQPISQNLTAIFSLNALWYLYAGGVLWVRNVGGKVLLHLCVLWEKELPTHASTIFFSQSNTDEQNTQRLTETLSQPITQSVTANVSWKASVISVCRRRSVSSKQCAKMLSELCALCERKKYPLCEKEIPSVRESTPLRARKNSQRNRDVKK